MHEFGDLLVETVRNRPREDEINNGAAMEDTVADLLESALKTGQITEEQFRANLKITFLTAHENAQQLLNSTFWELGKNLVVQQKLREEVTSVGTPNPSVELINQMPYLYSVVLELLRLYPPVSQLINRVSVEPSVLGGEVHIPARTWVGWNAFGVHTDRQSWGPNAREFVPERWGSDIKTIQSNMRMRAAQCQFIAFNAHSRKCLGQAFAVLEMKIVLFEMVRRLDWKVDPSYQLKLTSVSNS